MDLDLYSLKALRQIDHIYRYNHYWVYQNVVLYINLQIKQIEANHLN